MQPASFQPASSVRPRPEPVRILAVGDLAPASDFDLLLRAFAGVARWTAPARLIVVGEGDERAALEARIEDEGIADLVSLPGRIGRPRLAEWLQRAHIFAVTARRATSGAVLPPILPAAMAGGLCVVATDRGGIGRWIVDGESGLLVPPCDFPAYSRALHLAVGNPSWRRALGEAAAQAVRGGARRSA